MADRKLICECDTLRANVSAARKELAKLRKDVKLLKDMFLKRFKEVETMLKNKEKDVGNVSCIGEREMSAKPGDSNNLELECISKQQSLTSTVLAKSMVFTNQVPSCCVIGHIRTCFKEKNGIPRQGSLCPLSKAELLIDGVEDFTNPSHALEGLEKFSHVWLLFLFHKNRQNSVKAKVRPPRLDGKKVGVFASRSPHRPSPIGLTLAHLDGIVGNKLLLSGVDVLDGTPVLDIKPYIPDYDSVHSIFTGVDRKNFEGCMHRKGTFGRTVMFPTKAGNAELHVSTPLDKKVAAHKLCLTDEQGERETNNEISRVFIPDWIKEPPIASLSVAYSESALECLARFYGKHDMKSSQKNEVYCLELLSNTKDVQDSIEHILQEDPRSVYRRNQCPDNLYHFTIDKVNVSCIFRGNIVQVVNIEPIYNRNNKFDEMK